MKDAITRARAATAKATRQRDFWKRRAEDAEARLLEVELAMEAILPKIKAARWNAMSVAANAQLNG